MTSEHRRDQIYAQPRSTVEPFRFDQDVAAVFPDMIQRSVPGYRQITEMIGLFAEQFVQPDSCCFDLGCSLGAATLAMQRQLAGRGVTLYAVDNSLPMLERFRETLAADEEPSIQLICADIRHLNYHSASLVAMNFTLQFVPIADRLPLLRKIYQGLLPGGVLILSEKIRIPDSAGQIAMESLHIGFKRRCGYSELEISQKRSALEQVLLPETFAEHQSRLSRAGFHTITPWFQCFNFISMFALK